jgi:hypothetical protein
MRAGAVCGFMWQVRCVIAQSTAMRVSYVYRAVLLHFSDVTLVTQLLNACYHIHTCTPT